MTCSDIIIWFAERRHEPSLRRQIFASLGNVRSEIEHLEQLGILNRYYNIHKADYSYSLKNWVWYQARRAA